MNELLSRTWQSLAWRGAMALVFGILAALWPGITFMWLLVIFAAYALIGGIASVVVAFQNRKVNSDWWLISLIGLIWIAGGMLAIILPGLTAAMLVLIIGATALATGVIEVVMAIRLRLLCHSRAIQTFAHLDIDDALASSLLCHLPRRPSRVAKTQKRPNFLG